MQYITFNTGGKERSPYSRTLLAVPRWLNYCRIMQILPLLCRQGSLLFIETVQCIHYPIYTVTLYKFSCNGNGRKITRDLRPFNSDVLINLSVRVADPDPYPNPDPH
jgi:hypothetical protein